MGAAGFPRALHVERPRQISSHLAQAGPGALLLWRSCESIARQWVTAAAAPVDVGPRGVSQVSSARGSDASAGGLGVRSELTAGGALEGAGQLGGAHFAAQRVRLRVFEVTSSGERGDLHLLSLLQNKERGLLCAFRALPTSGAAASFFDFWFKTI